MPSEDGVKFFDKPTKEATLCLAFSMENGINLNGNDVIADYPAKTIRMDDIWIPLGDSLLIEKFKPVWNIVVDGFGHHDQGKGRRGQMKSAWDTLHPGRTWADKVEIPNSRSADHIATEINSFLHKQFST